MKEPLKQGDFIRIRRAYSDDEWCTGIVEKASPNGEHILMCVFDGALRPEGGGIITRFIAFTCDLEKGIATELLTETDLEVYVRDED